jgi:tetrahydromethanopterin S-methyltransferase subunit B
MRNNNLYFNSGESKIENQQIVLNGPRTVSVVDGGNEFVIENVKKIEIKVAEHNKVKISLGPQVTFISDNKKIVINEEKDKIFIEMLNSEEQLSKYTNVVNNQEANGLIDYIREYAPDLYTLDALKLQPIEVLRKLKESMDDLANCY